MLNYKGISLTLESVVIGRKEDVHTEEISMLTNVSDYMEAVIERITPCEQELRKSEAFV